MKAKIKNIQLNRSKSVSPVNAKDFKYDENSLELSKSLNTDDHNLMNQLSKKINLACNYNLNENASIKSPTHTTKLIVSV